MTLRACLITGVASIVVGSTAFSAQTKPSGIKSITLERKPCYGTCPVYKVTLKIDGSVDYDGVRFVERLGKYRAQFWSGQLEKLKAALDRDKFWTMKNRYAFPATDQATQIVTVVMADKTKTVEEYGPSGPQELWEIETMIDGLTQAAKSWKDVKSSRKS